jgi:hypothetical protein
LGTLLLWVSNLSFYTGFTYGNKYLLTIELLFYGIPGLEQYFNVDTSRTDNFIKFVSDAQNVTFAKEIVPTIDAIHFEIFKPIFEFIKSKCVADNTVTVAVA